MSYVLVVEDDAQAASGVRDFLASFGHSVRVVATPTEAVREIFWCHPEIVLADRCLPPPDGRALEVLCDRLAVPLLDLAGSICMMGQKSQWPEHAPLQLQSATR